jgi:hypothetical protein
VNTDVGVGTTSDGIVVATVTVGFSDGGPSEKRSRQ